MPTANVLIVDDEPDLVELVELTLQRMGLNARSAGTLRDAQVMALAEPFDLVLCDMRLPDGNGLDLVEWLQAKRPGLPCAVITAHGNVETAVRALKLGAFDFISKPLDLAALRRMISSALKLSERPEGDGVTFRGPRLLGQSAPMEQLRGMIARVARSQAPVHISGESGTGKELVARLIHLSGPRADGPFIAVNCGAIPGELMESELFGHKRGSFTGAVADKKGLIRNRRGRHAVSRRGGRPAAAHAGQAAARHPGEDPATGGWHRRGDGRRAPALGHAQGSRRTGGNGSISRGPLLPDQCHRDPRAGVARARRRYPGTGRTDPAAPGAASGGRPSELRRRRWSCCRATTTRATCASWKTYWSVRSRSGRMDRSALKTSSCDRWSAPSRQPQPEDSRRCGCAVQRASPRSGTALGSQLEVIERDAIVQALEKTRYNKTAAAQLLGMSFRALRYRIKKLGIE